MSAAVTREMSIVYGSVTVGGTSDYLLDGKVRVERDLSTFAIEFDVVVAGAASAAAFAASCAALEAAYALPRQDLVWSSGGSTLVTLTTSAGTGFNHRASAIKRGSDTDTGRSRRYTCRVEVDLPLEYDVGSRSGRTLDTTYEITTEPNGRTRLRVAGGYTATSAQGSAYAQAAAAMPTYINSLWLALGGTWQKIESRIVPDDADKFAAFEHISHTLLLAQSGGSIDHPAVTRSSLRVGRAIEAPGDSQASTQRLERISIRYTAVIDAAVSTDPIGLYNSTLRAWLLSYMRTQTGASAIAIIAEAPEVHGDENELIVSMTVLAHSGGNVIESRDEVKTEELPGKLFTPVWGGGSPYAARVDQGPALRTRRRIASRITVGSSGGGSAQGNGLQGQLAGAGSFAGAPGPAGAPSLGGTFSGSPGVDLIAPASPGGGGEDAGSDGPGTWHVVYVGGYERPIVYGQAGTQINATETVSETLERYIETPTGVASGGGAPASGDGGSIPDPSGGISTPRNP